MTKGSGQIIKGVGGLYRVELKDGQIIKCKIRGKLRLDGDAFIGDYVQVSYDNKGEGIIEKIEERKSQLVRPYVSNIDGIIIVVSPIPEPNYLLVDKMIIGAVEQQITPIICINKPSLDGYAQLVERINKDYSTLADIIEIDALTGKGSKILREKIKGKFFALAGQSAVGKSTFINQMIGKDIMETGEVSKHNEKGRNITRHIEIIKFEDGTKVADTCGFDKLQMPVADPANLATYFVDFDEFVSGCKFKMCRHIDEDVCGVKKAVSEGKLSKDRYDRYVKLYLESQKRWNTRYDKR